MCDLGLFAVLVPHNSVCSMLLHRGGVLVHRLHVVRESRGDYCESTQWHICWHPPGGRASVHNRTIWGRNRRNASLSLVGSETPFCRGTRIVGAPRGYVIVSSRQVKPRAHELRREY